MKPMCVKRASDDHACAQGFQYRICLKRICLLRCTGWQTRCWGRRGMSTTRFPIMHEEMQLSHWTTMLPRTDLATTVCTGNTGETTIWLLMICVTISSHGSQSCISIQIRMNLTSNVCMCVVAIHWSSSHKRLYRFRVNGNALLCSARLLASSDNQEGFRLSFTI